MTYRSHDRRNNVGQRRCYFHDKLLSVRERADSRRAATHHVGNYHFSLGEALRELQPCPPKHGGPSNEHTARSKTHGAIFFLFVVQTNLFVLLWELDPMPLLSRAVHMEGSSHVRHIRHQEKALVSRDLQLQLIVKRHPLKRVLDLQKESKNPRPVSEIQQPHQQNKPIHCICPLPHLDHVGIGKSNVKVVLKQASHKHVVLAIGRHHWHHNIQKSKVP